MEGIIIKSSKLMAKESKVSQIIGETSKGQHVTITKPKLTSNFNPWVGITTDEGLCGYIRQETLIELNSKYILQDLKICLYTGLEVDSKIAFSMERGYIFTITDVIITDDSICYKVETNLGSGYIQALPDVELLRIVQDQADKKYNQAINIFIGSGTKNGIGMVLTAIAVSFAGYYLFKKLFILGLLFFVTGIIAICLDQYRKKHY